MTEIKRKFNWRHMSEVYLELRAYIETGIDVFFYGMSGIGKSSLIKSVLEDIDTLHVWIDCVIWQGETEIFKCIRFGLPDHPAEFQPKSLFLFHSTANFVKSTLTKGNICYFIFTKVSKVLRTDLFQKLLVLKATLREYVRFLIVSDEFVPSTKYCSEFLLLNSGFVFLLMPSPNVLHLETVLREKLPISCPYEVFGNFVSIIYQTFSTYTENIKYYKHICEELLPIYTAPLSNDKSVGELYNTEFREALLEKLKSLFIFINVPEETEEVEEDQEEEDILDVYERATRLGVSYLGGILLVASYIACHSPPKNDKTLFANSLLNTKKRKVKVQKKIYAKKADLDRIVAIAEYFLSLKDAESFECKALRHTNLFYTEINNLVRSGYLKTGFYKISDLSTVCYLTTVDYSVIERLAEDLGIRLFEYLPQDIPCEMTK